MAAAIGDLWSLLTREVSTLVERAIMCHKTISDSDVQNCLQNLLE